MKKLIIFLFLLFLFIFPQKVFADGMIAPPPNYWLEETGQKAVIFHQDNQETLILSVSFRGNAKDFGWLIPLPTRPEVEKSTDELFIALEELTQPNYRILEDKGGIEPLPMMGAPEQQVTVWETKKVDIYEISVLSATDKDALVKWLNKNEYQYPKTQGYILEEYINMNWYFVATKINTESLGDLAEAQLREGHATPLKLSFETEKPFYPLKISSVMTDFLEQPKAGQPEELMIIRPKPSQQVSVVLYVFSNYKATLPGFQTIYSGWLKPEKIENLAQVQGESWLKIDKGKYLTRLQRSFTLAEMNNDLWIRKAEDNEPVGAGEDKNLLSREKRLLLVLGVPLLLEVLVVLVFFVFKGGRKSEPQAKL